MMETFPDLVKWDDLAEPILVCSPGGGELGSRPRTVVIGPEGGFSDDEIPDGFARWNLGPNVLRVETAAVVAVARILG